ncbi:histone H1, early embryonic-like isoform X2 [Cloeon dipterum]|uniref:histone H1, early embryonic-like isoform X2 n=1 Tax=Cloeon dipterum TaxID=197152 RepID=UPI00321F63D4
MLVERQAFKMIKLGVCFIVLNVIGSSLAAPANDVSNLKIAQKPEGKPADLGASNNKLQAAPVIQSDEKNKEQKVQSLIAVADAAVAELPQQKKPIDDSAFKNNLQNLKGSIRSDQDMVMSAAVLPDDKKENKPKMQPISAISDTVNAEPPQPKMKIHQIQDSVGETGDSQQNKLVPLNKAVQIDVMNAPTMLQGKPQAISGENVQNSGEKKTINLKGVMPVKAEIPSKLSVKSPAGNAKSDPKNTDAQPQAISLKNGQNSDGKKAVDTKAKIPDAKVPSKPTGSASEVKAPVKGKAVAQVKSKQNKVPAVPAEKKPAVKSDKPKQTPAESGKPVAKVENPPNKTSKIKAKAAKKP